MMLERRWQSTPSPICVSIVKYQGMPQIEVVGAVGGIHSIDRRWRSQLLDTSKEINHDVHSGNENFSCDQDDDYSAN